MTAFSDNIVIFEDQSDNLRTIRSALEDTLSGDLEVRKADINQEIGPNPREAVETIMEGFGTPLLTLLDWDLTMGTGAISRDNVITYCENNHIPLCIYHARDTGQSDQEKVQDYEEDLIKLDTNLTWEEIGVHSAHIADGFDEIRKTIESVFNNDEEKPIPELLDAPLSVRGKLDQYSWGNPGVIKSGQKDLTQDEIIKRATTNQGYWILNELLEFPGALLNEVALAAYLNVNHEKFCENDEYKSPFNEASYTGPFDGLENWWWTPLVDDISIEQKRENEPKGPIGPKLFDRLGLPEIDEAQCHSELANGCGPARYYCIIKERPVCKEHSRSPDGWIPKGATQSRVSEEDYDQLKPWVMM
jgi:hypothetical protein